MKITVLIHSKITALLLEAKLQNKIEKSTQTQLPSTTQDDKTQFHKFQVRNDLTAQKKHTQTITQL